MIKIPVSTVWWSNNVDAGGLYGKSLAAKKDLALWYLGHGVLIEQKGKPDRLVPIANVLTVEAVESVTPEQWGGGGVPGVIGSSGEGAPKGASMLVPDKSPDAAPRRGPGRPPKV